MLVIACLVVARRPAWAQGEGAIHGRVVAAADDAALPHAAVTLRSVSTGEAVQTTTADAAGRFVFAGVQGRPNTRSLPRTTGSGRATCG